MKEFEGKNLRICPYCRHEGKEGCLTACAPEARYRHLEPVPLEHWENLPQLPSLEEIVKMDRSTVLALYYLAIYYLREMATRDIG